MDKRWIEVEALVRRAQAGDRQAFGELVERFQSSVYAQARMRQRDDHEAAELVQEVFLHALRKINQLREPACFGAWLRKITVRVSINHACRRPPLQTVNAEVLEVGGQSTDGPLEQILHRERRDTVRAAVAKLRPIDRDALEAFYMKGKSLNEIADDLDVPLGTVKRRLHVARRRLQDSMQSAEPAEPRPVAEAGERLGDDGYVVRHRNRCKRAVEKGVELEPVLS